MNRSEWMSNKFKEDNMSYGWVPEIITSIDPAPSYHNKALESKGSLLNLKKRRANEAFEKVKNGLIKKNMMQERATTGRLWAHIKHIEMRN